MSGSVALTIDTGSAWNVQVTWTNADGSPVVFANPTMDIRQELSPTGKRLASLDSTGTQEGTITVNDDGSILLSMDDSVTKGLQTGNGFWDLFVQVGGKRVRMLFGTIEIVPHVTDVQ